jgi:outer membrane protein W
MSQGMLKAQNYSTYNHDFGIMAGPVFFQSDYGERYDFNNYVKNIGYSIGAFYYLDTQNNYHTNFSDYVKYRAEVSYMKNDLQHYGQWVDNDKTNLATRQLRAMRGSVEALNVGLQLEYFPWKNDDYSYKDWNPYVSLGLQYSFYTSKAWSEIGTLGDPAVTFPKYINAFRNTSSSVFSVTGSVGTRYRLDDKSSLIADLRVQYYGSDWVDGLNPDSKVYSENKTNDWLVWLNFGYIYSFD